MKQHQQFSTRDEEQMHDETVLMDQGIVRGLRALRNTTGIVVDPWLASQYSVLDVAVLRFLNTLPQHQSISDAVNGMHRRPTLAARSAFN